MRASKSRSRSKNNRNRNSLGNVVNRVFDSSGPEGKVRGTPQQIIDKYNQLARDAALANDRVAAENFQQHAEHYLRMLAEAQREQDQKREQQERENRERQAQRDRDRAEREAPKQDGRHPAAGRTAAQHPAQKLPPSENADQPPTSWTSTRARRGRAWLRRRRRAPRPGAPTPSVGARKSDDARRGNGEERSARRPPIGRTNAPKPRTRVAASRRARRPLTARRKTPRVAAGQTADSSSERGRIAAFS